MNIEVRYMSRSGNTQKVAEAIAQEAKVDAKLVRYPVSPNTDILFLGGAVYAFGIDEEVKLFISDLPGSVKKVAVFSTAALVKSAFPQIKKLLYERDIHVFDKDFHCRGAFKIMHRGRPNEEDLRHARAYAREIINS